MKNYKPKMKESQIQSAILEWLHYKNIFHRKINTTGIYVKARDSYITNPSKGMADIFALHNGIHYAIEVKSETGTLSQEQMNYLNAVNNAGGIGVVVRSLDDVIELFENAKVF